MPTDDVSDLRDVVDAINRLCETMKTSDYGGNNDSNDVELCEEDVVTEVQIESEVGLVSPEQIVVCEVETYVAELWSDASSHQVDVYAAADSPTPIDDVSTLDLDCADSNQSTLLDCVDSNQSTLVETIDTVSSKFPLNHERNVDSVVLDSFVTRGENVQSSTSSQSVAPIESVVSIASESNVFDQEQIAASFEPVSEIYYMASSKVSLLSDVELPDRIHEETMEERESLTRDDRNGVMAGHVAAMRERFESMTRANTPCPDAMSSVSPSVDVYRNITPSPDHLG